MKALTVKQPWATAIAQFGKNVENRTTKPPASIIGQRIAIVAGLNNDQWLHYKRGEHMIAPLSPLEAWANSQQTDKPPLAGMVVATAVVAAWFTEGERSFGGVYNPLFRTTAIRRLMQTGMVFDEAEAYLKSPWFSGPVGWVLTDIRPAHCLVGPVRGMPGVFELPAEFEYLLRKDGLL